MKSIFVLVFLIGTASHADTPDISIIGNSVVVECNGKEFRRSMNDSTESLADWIQEVCKTDQ